MVFITSNFTSVKRDMEPNASPCEKDVDGNSLDAITYAPIPPERLIMLSAGNTISCFDIDSLYRYADDNNLKIPLNPYTRTVVDRDTANQIRIYGEKTKKLITVRSDTEDGLNVHRIPQHKSIGYLIAAVISRGIATSFQVALHMDVVVAEFGQPPKSLYRKDLENDSIDIDMNLKLVPFANTRDEILSLTKLVEYTKDKLYEHGTHNNAIHYNASRFVSAGLLGEYTSDDEDINGAGVHSPRWESTDSEPPTDDESSVESSSLVDIYLRELISQRIAQDSLDQFRPPRQRGSNSPLTYQNSSGNGGTGYGDESPYYSQRFEFGPSLLYGSAQRRRSPSPRRTLQDNYGSDSEDNSDANSNESFESSERRRRSRGPSPRSGSP